jgi:hypothetical protein
LARRRSLEAPRALVDGRFERRGGEGRVLTKEPGAGLWKRTKVGFMRILPVKSQL